MPEEILVFYVPVATTEMADALAREVVSAGLAACANTFPIRSAYGWQGTLQADAETVLILKTFPDREERVEAFLATRHSYAVPAILRWPARVNAAYAEWMRSVLD